MKKYKPIVFIFALVLGIVILFATAVGGGTHNDGRKGQDRDLKNHFPKADRWQHFPITRYRVMKELGLSDEQWEDIKSLRYKLKEEMVKIRDQHKEDVLNVLTPSQRDTLEIRIKELEGLEKYRRQHRHRHRNDYRYEEGRHGEYNNAPFLEYIDYVKPDNSPPYAVTPLHISPVQSTTRLPSIYKLDENLLIANKPIVVKSPQISWGHLKNMHR